MPMLVTRQERGLAIDGAYIHVRTIVLSYLALFWSMAYIQIMPSSNKARAVFDSGKTTSFHIKTVVACQQSSKSSSIFKLVVQHDNRNKRYDFEAESSKLAGMSFFFLVCSVCSDFCLQEKLCRISVDSKQLWIDQEQSIGRGEVDRWSDRLCTNNSAM